uniref:MCP four helix bundle domain-containing protein n=1 Tax=Paracidovorax wautersii TaxID=1177982 RepID=UPI0031D6A49E
MIPIRLKVKTQLSLAFGALVIMVLVVAALSLLSLSSANGKFIGYVHGIEAQSDLASGMRDAVSRRAIAVRNLVLVTAPSDIDKELKLVREADEEVQKDLAALTQAVAKDGAIPESTRGLLNDLTRIESVYGPVARDIVRLAMAGQHQAAVTKIDKECRPLLAELTGKAGDFVADAGVRATKIEEATVESFSHQRSILTVACLAALALAIVSGVVITSRLARALGAEPAELGLAAQRVAEGDLSPLENAHALTDGSVMASLAAMRHSLASMVAQVRHASDSIVTGSTEIAAGARDLSVRTEQQASALQQTSATMEELSSTVRHNADNAQQANRLV